MSFSPSNFEPEDLSERELKIGYWLTAHRVQLRQTLIIALIVFDVLLVGFNLFRWGHYGFFGYWQDKQQIAQLVASPTFYEARQHFKAAPLIIGEVKIFGAGDKSDIAVSLKNPNERFLVSFDYNFDLGGVKTFLRRGFLLPGEEKPMVEWGVKGVGGGAVFELKNFSWQRISSHQVGETAVYLQRHLSFKTSEVSFTPAANGFLSQARLIFNLANETIFSYYEPRFLILLEAGGSLVGVEQVVFDKFLAGEEKKVDLRLFYQTSGPSEIRVLPDINIFDLEAFIR